jgi:tetratricopeptide (TPR) repeat protein
VQNERDRAERTARRSQEVRDALGRVAVLRERARAPGDVGKWAEALALARRAEALAETGPVEPGLAEQVNDLRRELDEEDDDRRVVRGLEQVRLLLAAEVNFKKSDFARERALPEYRKVFAEYGLRADGLGPAEAAERILGRPPQVRGPLVAALDEWLELARQEKAGEAGWLERVLAAADPDDWRQRARAARAGRDPQALLNLAREVEVAGQPPQALVLLAVALFERGSTEGAVELLRRAWDAYSGDFWISHRLGCFLLASRPSQPDEAILFLTVAVALRPRSPGAHLNLGNAFFDKGQWDKAIACFEKALALDQKYPGAHNNLGLALYRKRQVDKAIECYHKAIALEPKLAHAHYNLGAALDDTGQLDDAIGCFRRAIALEPKFAQAHCRLGAALGRKRQVDEAIACFRRAIALAPEDAHAHYNLGNALYGKRQLGEAIACYQRALACSQKALALDPMVALAHSDLGFALDAAGKQKEAIEAWRAAVRLEPGLARTHYWLGKALLLQGRPGEALVPLEEAAKRLPAEQVRALGLPAERSRAERLSRLEKRLPDLLAGKDRLGDNRERLDLVDLCRRQHRFAAAARFFTEAFDSEAKLADELTAAHRYNAACCAALAAAGRGEDAAKPGAKERLALRRQALTWLRADLALWSRLFAEGEVGRSRLTRVLTHWQKDPDLAGLRDKAALDELPAQEQKAFDQLWSDVAALLAKTAGAPK